MFPCFDSSNPDHDIHLPILALAAARNFGLGSVKVMARQECLASRVAVTDTVTDTDTDTDTGGNRDRQA